MTQPHSPAPAADGVIDIAVVGGGVSGLALARMLSRAGREVHVFEARERLGGRVESAACSSAPTRLDLGPTWYWPRTQPLMAELIPALELRDFPQHDSGEALILEDTENPARSVQCGRLHAHAHRLSGGMATLVDALAAELPQSRVHLGHALGAVRRREQQLELGFVHDGQERTINARKLVLAVPPRLIAERVQFEPALPEAVQAALEASPTWMATQAKAQLVFERALWREAGHSGNAFVQHEQAVLKEIFDACEPEHNVAALGAFLGLSPRERRSFQAGLPMLLSSQMTQLFGSVLWEVEQHYRDWSAEAWTCSERDLREHSAQPQHPEPGSPALQTSHWDAQLFFAGSETAEREAGYLEGALQAAERVAQALGVDSSALGRDAQPAFRSWLDERMQATLSDYQARIFATLHEQDSDRATQRALVGATERLFEDALTQLQSGLLLAERDHEAVRDFLGSLLSEVLTFNRRSCALSNFGDEHRPSQQYVQDILRDVNAAYSEFAREADRLVNA